MSNIETIVKASADVIKIVNLKEGDIIKMVDTSTTYNAIKFAIVVQLYFDGENSAVEVHAYDKEYGEVKKEYKLLIPDSKYLLHPSSQQELTDFLKDNVSYMERKIEEKEKELTSKKEALEFAKKLINGDIVKQYTTPVYERISQKD